MLRSDTTALFERLREANILLQEVLSGAHQNMSSLEQTLVTRVSEFVAAMNEVADRSGAATGQVEHHITNFRDVTSKVLADLSLLASQFDAHGRGLVEAVGLLDQSNRRAEETLGERRAALDQLAVELDGRTGEIEQRLKRFSALLDEFLDGANSRARDIARIIAESSTQGVQTLEQERQRTSETLMGIQNQTGELLRGINKQTADTLRAVYAEHGGQTHEMFSESARRFAETLQGMKQMTAEMQRELETTRTELRRGILELPQETAESASQMRRVIVDQIEALAELNRIVARHGRGIDVAEPARRSVREEAVAGAPAGPRMEGRAAPSRPAPMPPRDDIAGAPAPMPPPQRRAESPSLSPGQNGNGRSGWLSDLLHRASRPEELADR